MTITVVSQTVTYMALFDRSLWAGVQPALDSSAETVLNRSNVPVQGEEGS